MALAASADAEIPLAARSDTFELQRIGAAAVAIGCFIALCCRACCATGSDRAGITMLPGSVWLRALCLVAALAGELLGRYLFFVSVVPKNMAAVLSAGGAAA